MHLASRVWLPQLIPTSTARVRSSSQSISNRRTRGYRVSPVRLDRADAVEVGELEDVERFSAGSRPQGKVRVLGYVPSSDRVTVVEVPGQLVALEAAS